MARRKKEYTEEQKAEYRKAKDAEKKEMDNRLESFLADALQDKGSIETLMAHYKIGKLYTYSLLNSFLIMLQGGKIAQGYHKWPKVGRHVKRGESSNIVVYVPIIKKDKNDPNDEGTCVGFKLGKVFDVSQTEGKPLEYDHNSKDNANVKYEDIKKVMAKMIGGEITERYTGTARGWADHDENIAISEMSNNTDKIKTLFHEVAHQRLHIKKPELKISRAAGEVEAESVAYLVCSYLGLDYSLSKEYVANYKSGIGEARKHKIVKVAYDIIKALDGKK